jgi:hypothetical protein
MPESKITTVVMMSVADNDTRLNGHTGERIIKD